LSLAEIREYFSRHFLGRVRVTRCDPPLPPPVCHLLRRTVETHPIRTRMRVLSAELFSVGGMSCSHRGFRFSSQLVRVRGSRITRYVPQEIAVGRVSLLSVRVLSDLGRALRPPQERGGGVAGARVRPRCDSGTGRVQVTRGSCRPVDNYPRPSVGSAGVTWPSR